MFSPSPITSIAQVDAQARTVTTVHEAVASVEGKCEVVVKMLGEVSGGEGVQHLVATTRQLIDSVAGVQRSLGPVPESLAQLTRSLGTVTADVTRAQSEVAAQVGGGGTGIPRVQGGGCAGEGKIA